MATRRRFGAPEYGGRPGLAGLFFCVLIWGTGCSFSTGEAFAMIVGPSAPVGTRLGPGDHRVTVEVDGRARAYGLHVPPQVEEQRPLPVVISLHDRGLPAKRLDRAADGRGFLAVYPQGTGPETTRTWNAGSCCGAPYAQAVDDVGFVLAVLADLAGRVAVDPTRLYVFGEGEGANLALRLAHDAGDYFAAVAAVNGNFTTTRFAPRARLGLLDVRVGTAAGLGPSGGGTAVPPEVVLQWARFHGCAEPIVQRAQRRGHEMVELLYTNCEPGVDAWLLSDFAAAPRLGAEILAFLFSYRSVAAPPLAPPAAIREDYPERDRPPAVTRLGNELGDAVGLSLDRQSASATFELTSAARLSPGGGPFADRRLGLHAAFSLYSYLSRGADGVSGLQVMAQLDLHAAMPELPAAGDDLRWLGGRLGFSALYLNRAQETFYLWVGASIAEDSDSLDPPQVRPEVLGFGSYRLNDTWALLYGGASTYRFGAETALPLLGVSVVPVSWLRIILLAPLVAGVELQVRDDLELSLFAAAAGGQQRITNQTFPEEPRILRLNIVQGRYGATVRYRPLDGLELSATVGLLAPRWLTVVKKTGEVVSFDVDPAAFGRLGVRYFF